MAALAASNKNDPIDLYSSLATEQELQTLSGKQPVDSLGVRAMKEFHLKDKECYDRDLKDKIFFIA